MGCTSYLTLPAIRVREITFLGWKCEFGNVVTFLGSTGTQKERIRKTGKNTSIS
jgi:hypothetical protein